MKMPMDLCMQAAMKLESCKEEELDSFVTYSRSLKARSYELRLHITFHSLSATLLFLLASFVHLLKCKKQRRTYQVRNQRVLTCTPT
jgi:hypothetical protein